MGLLDELDELRARHATGQLTDEAFEAAKQRLLGSPPERRPTGPTGPAGPSAPSAPYLPPPSGPPATSLPYGPPGLHTLGRWVQGLLIAAGVLFGISSAAGLNAWRVFTDFTEGIAGVDGLVAAEDGYWSTFGIAFLSMLVTSVVFIVWMFRYWEQLRVALHGRTPRRGRGWTIGGWFIPIASLWIPKQVVDDFWRLTSGPPTDEASWQARPVAGTVHLWWGAFLLGGALQQVSGSLEPAVDDLDAWHTYYATLIVGDVVFAVAAFLAARVVSTLVARLSEITGYQRSGSAAPVPA